MEQNLTTLVPLVAGVASLIATIAAWRAASATRSAVRTQIILEFFKRDAQKEFGEAINILWDFKNQSDDDIAISFDKLKASPNEWLKVDNARRVVHKFWLQLMHVKHAGLLKNEDFITVVFKHQLRTILEILEPLEKTKPGFGFSKPAFDEYRKIYENYDESFKKKYGYAPPVNNET